MKLNLPNLDILAMIAIVALMFLPWSGLLNTNGFDLAIGALKNGGSIEDYLIAATLIAAVLALALAIMGRSGEPFILIASVTPIAAFIFGMIDHGSNYITSIENGYLITLIVVLLLLLKRAGIIKVR